VKTRERSAAGARTAVPGPGGAGPGGPGERLPVAPRERRPALAALAALLILVGALGATVLVMRAGDRVSAVKITANVTSGTRIPASAMTEVQVAKNSGVSYVPWAQHDLVHSRYYAATDLVGGTLLVGQMLTTQPGAVGSGKAVVGLSLSAGQYPDGLKVGDVVNVYEVGQNAAKSAAGDGGSGDGGSGGTILASHARIQTLPSSGGGGAGGGGDSHFSVIVDQDDASAVTIAASAGDAAIALVPRG
jgi:hypothetical protein